MRQLAKIEITLKEKEEGGLQIGLKTKYLNLSRLTLIGLLEEAKRLLLQEHESDGIQG